MKYRLTVPEEYRPALSILEIEEAIKSIKDFFERNLAEALNLMRVTAPLFVRSGTGVNDDLNGVEQPVRFSVNGSGDDEVEIVQSLAKWKRLALARYGFDNGRRTLHRYERHPARRGAGQPPLDLRRPVGLGEGHRARTSEPSRR